MHDLAAAEEHADLAAVAVFEEAADVAHLGLVVMVVGLGTDLDFLDLHHSLVLLGFLLLLLLFVLELAEVHDAADRGFGVGSHFHQVIALLMGHSDSVRTGQDADLFTFRANDPHFAGANLLVAAHAVLRHVAARSHVRRSYSSYLHA